MNERLKKLRKSLDLTQQEFANRINIKRNTLANYETGRNDPIDAVISLICREFNVNETWLRTGEGEMFDKPNQSIVDRLCKEKNATPLERQLLEAYFEIDVSIRDEFVTRMLDKFRAFKKSQTVQEEEHTPDAPKTEQSAIAQSAPDTIARIEELERQNRELAAKIAVLEEEDAEERGMPVSPLIGVRQT